MGRLRTSFLAAVTVLLPVLVTAAHGDGRLGSALRNQEVVVTGHERPDPRLHFEALSGTVEPHCPGCLLDKREPARASGTGSAAKRETQVRRGQTEVTPRRQLELPANRSPRAPPAA